MKRYDRIRFAALGLAPGVNGVALALYGLGLATHGRGAAANALPLVAGLAVVCLLIALGAAIRQGRDINWPPWLTLLGFWVSLGLGPILLLLLGYLASAKPREAATRYGPPPEPANALTWGWALVNLIWPWALFAGVVALT